MADARRCLSDHLASRTATPGPFFAPSPAPTPGHSTTSPTSDHPGRWFCPTVGVWLPGNGPHLRTRLLPAKCCSPRTYRADPDRVICGPEGLDNLRAPCRL